MTYIAHDARLVPEAFESNRSQKAPKQGFWNKLMKSFVEARQRAAEREIARYIALNGGALTDSLEREISRRFEMQRF
jgi:hypothetical protein